VAKLTREQRIAIEDVVYEAFQTCLGLKLKDFGKVPSERGTGLGYTHQTWGERVAAILVYLEGKGCGGLDVNIVERDTFGVSLTEGAECVKTSIIRVKEGGAHA
jgi:hypothetical protein